MEEERRKQGRRQDVMAGSSSVDNPVDPGKITHAKQDTYKIYIYDPVHESIVMITCDSNENSGQAYTKVCNLA